MTDTVHVLSVSYGGSDGTPVGVYRKLETAQQVFMEQYASEKTREYGEWVHETPPDYKRDLWHIVTDYGHATPTIFVEAVQS